MGGGYRVNKSRPNVSNVQLKYLELQPVYFTERITWQNMFYSSSERGKVISFETNLALDALWLHVSPRILAIHLLHWTANRVRSNAKTHILMLSFLHVNHHIISHR